MTLDFLSYGLGSMAKRSYYTEHFEIYKMILRLKIVTQQFEEDKQKYDSI